VGRLKDVYDSGIRALDDLADELSANSQSTLENLNSQAVRHCSIFEEVGIDFSCYKLSFLTSW